MGRGVAQRFACYGYNVILVDIKDSVLEQAEMDIHTNLRFQKMMKKIDIDIDEVMKRIHYGTSYQLLKDVDFIIENVPEVMELKKGVYLEIDKICKEEAYYLVNTSCISITEIASFTTRPMKVIGVHFMNPVPMKNFAEVICGYYTSQDTIHKVTTLLEEIDIACEVINDSVGFVSNRLSHLFMNEAANLVYEKVAEVSQIDQIFIKGFGHAMGPLATADLIGIDTVLNSLEILYHHYEDPKFRACPLLKKMVNAGLLGKKSGKGFYNYDS